MKDNSKKTSIRSIIIITFLLFMLITIFSIGYMVFNNWISSARQITESIAEDINDSLYEQIYSFINTPNHINEVNHKIIENDILDLADEKLREKFFVGVLSSQDDELYSFSYGTENGEYYGARRNENGVIEIMRNNASTGGNSWYYSVNDDLTAGDLVIKAGQFDPRTRAWYKEAVKAGKVTYSPIYKHFVMDDLTISVACPVYKIDGNLQGVLGSHILLTDIGAFLKNTVSKYNGYAIIIEKGSNNLIANSMEIDNFTVLSDGTLKRFDINEIRNFDFQEAYEKYNDSLDPHFFYEGKEQNLYINVKEIHMEGLDWIVISAFPEKLLITPVLRSIHLTALLSIMALLLSFAIYYIITGKIMTSINNLLQFSDVVASGDLNKRIEVVRNDEIGKISESFNKVVDKMQFFINNLETTVNERTDELQKTNMKLEENKNQLRLILDSSAEAIYGIDLDGNCTFCNISCIRMLGYKSEEELLGKNMHYQIHHSRADKTLLPAEECKVFKAIKNKSGTQADDEVFWKADGTYFEVEYHAYPQIKNKEIIGAVITFMDISDRRQKEKEIQYLSYHDVLTGLQNRRYFEQNLTKIDNYDNLPLSVIFADINGLKMTNDIFGHAAGDELIKKSAEILLQSCRENDMIARIGGDEFIILLPKTNIENAEKILSRIKFGFLNARVEAIKCSISLGVSTKTIANQSLEEVMASAENAMYKDKTMNRKSINKDIIDTIVDTLHSKSPREKQHSIVVSELCDEIGSALNLSDSMMNKLKRTGYLHDIGKIVLDDSILFKDTLSEEEYEIMQQHSLVGYRILNLFDETLDLAEYVYSHHERWDGNGYPRGLVGEQIPLLSRIVSIAETYERVISKSNLSIKDSKNEAIKIIQEGGGKQFDPQIVELFIRIMNKK